MTESLEFTEDVSGWTCVVDTGPFRVTLDQNGQIVLLEAWQRKLDGTFPYYWLKAGDSAGQLAADRQGRAIERAERAEAAIAACLAIMDEPFLGDWHFNEIIEPRLRAALDSTDG